MHLLHITPRYPPAHGGAETHIAELSRRFVQAGHQVTVMTSDALAYEYFWDRQAARISPHRREEQIDGVKVLRFPIVHLPGPAKSYDAVRRLLWLQARLINRPTRLSYRLAKSAPRLPTLWRAVANSETRYDLVAGINIAYETFLLAGAEIGRRQRIPFLTFPLTHLGAGKRPGHDPRSRFYTMPHQRQLIVQSAGLIAQTETERAFYTEQGMSSDHCVVAGPGIEPAAVQGGNGDRWRRKHGVAGPLILSLGTLSQDKGTLTLIEAFQRLSKEIPDLTLVLAGHIAPEMAPHLPLSGERGDEDRAIRVLGPIKREEKLDLLAAADIVAVPSRIDSFGIVYLEAWANKKPVIAADAWGMSDVVTHGETGLITPFGEPEPLKEGLHTLLNHPGRRSVMGQRGYAEVMARHTWQHKFDIVREAYETALRKHSI